MAKPVKFKPTDSAIFKTIVIEASDRGLPLSQVCAEAGICRQTLNTWRNKPPQALQAYFAIMSAFGLQAPGAPEIAVSDADEPW